MVDSYITRLQEIELIAGDSGIVLEFQVFYEDREPLDLQDDIAKWYLAPLGMKHIPILEKDGKILCDNSDKGRLYYRFTVSPNINAVKMPLAGYQNKAKTSGFNIYIENFVNNQSQDVQTFAQELEFYSRRNALSLG